MVPLCNATIGHHLARPAPHFLNPYAILLGFYSGHRPRGFRDGRELGSAHRMHQEVTMLRMRILAASLIALAGNIGAAAAADVGAYTPAPEAPPYTPNQGFTWTGPYVGGMIGYGWGKSKSGGTPPLPTA